MSNYPGSEFIYDANEPPVSGQKGYSGAYYPLEGIYRSPYDLQEHNPELAWPANIPIYKAMRYDSQCNAVLNALRLLVLSMSYSLDPAGCENEGFVQALADRYGIPVLGIEASAAHGGTTVPWTEHLDEMVDTVTTFGFAPYEMEVEVVDGYTLPKHLDVRPPGTLVRIITDARGDIIQARQSAPNEAMPGSSLVWYKVGGIGATPTGVSLLRPAYKPWYIKDQIERVNVGNARRFGSVVPNFEMPLGATKDEIEAAAELASKYQPGDTSGMATPGGAKFALTGPSGTMPALLEDIRYYDAAISKTFLEMFLELGSQSHGARSLGETQLDLVRHVVESLTWKLINQHNDQAIRRYTEWTFGPGAAAPRIVAGSIDAEDNLPPEALAMLVEAGIITSDLGLETDTRQRYNLPQIDDPSSHVNLHVVPTDTLPPTTGTPGTPPMGSPGQVALAAERPKVGAAVQAAGTTTERRKEGTAAALATATIATAHSREISQAITDSYPDPTDIADQAVATSGDPSDISALLAGLTIAGGLAGLSGALSSIHTDAATYGSTAAATETGTAAISDGVQLQAIQDQLEKWVGGIDQTTRDQMATALVDGLANGNDVATLAGSLSDILGNAERADMIANTEARRAYMSAKMDTYTSAGVEQLFWDTGEHCEECTANQDASPIDITDDWPNGDPPVHPNCTCDVFAGPPVDDAPPADNAEE